MAASVRRSCDLSESSEPLSDSETARAENITRRPVTDSRGAGDGAHIVERLRNDEAMRA